jgi:hypothetical protein
MPYCSSNKPHSLLSLRANGLAAGSRQSVRHEVHILNSPSQGAHNVDTIFIDALEHFAEEVLVVEGAFEVVALGFDGLTRVLLAGWIIGISSEEDLLSYLRVFHIWEESKFRHNDRWDDKSAHVAGLNVESPLMRQTFGLECVPDVAELLSDILRRDVRRGHADLAIQPAIGLDVGVDDAVRPQRVA